MLTKIFLEENLDEPAPSEKIEAAGAKKYIDGIVTRLSSIENEIMAERDGRIIVLAENGDFNYCLNGFSKTMTREIVERLDETVR